LAPVQHTSKVVMEAISFLQALLLTIPRKYLYQASQHWRVGDPLVLFTSLDRRKREASVVVGLHGTRWVPTACWIWRKWREKWEIGETYAFQQVPGGVANLVPGWKWTYSWKRCSNDLWLGGNDQSRNDSEKIFIRSGRLEPQSSVQYKWSRKLVEVPYTEQTEIQF